MLDVARVEAALAAKAGDLGRFEQRQGHTLDDYRRRWEAAARLPQAEVEARLQGIPWPGARPTAEQARGLPVIPFEPRWRNHEEARAWAQQVLWGVPTFAVDGSQITPSKDYSLPVAAVQVGWFENPHRADVPYVKDVSFSVLGPGDLSHGRGGDADGSFDSEVGWQRFAAECRRLTEYIEAHAGTEPAPVCFFDGSFIISFVQHLDPARQEAYVGAVRALLAASERCRVPLVGYVDTSYARDLVAMLDALEPERPRQDATDASFLRPAMHWGDRTPAWLCARDDNVQATGGKFYDQVALVYLKTTAENAPARLELPRWILENGRLEAVLDVVRAECLIGLGYPYAAETADAVAVLTVEDRERFYAILQRFAEQQHLPLRFSRKAGSKKMRR